MKINILTLYSALKHIRQPTGEGDVLQVPLYDRVEMLRSMSNVDPVNDTQKTFSTLTLTAKKYCTSPNNCWYEWEIDL